LFVEEAGDFASPIPMRRAGSMRRAGHASILSCSVAFPNDSAEPKLERFAAPERAKSGC
jgi:hypothetical protein